MLRLRVKGFGFLAGLVLLGLVGCGGRGGDSLPRQPVEGVVTLDGAPVEKGTIQFMPTPGTAHATLASAMIKDGKYSIPKDRGPVPGGYRVIISAPDPKAPAVIDEDPGGEAPPPLPDLIPSQYNASSTLNAEIKAGPNVHDFTLKR